MPAGARTRLVPAVALPSGPKLAMSLQGPGEAEFTYIDDNSSRSNREGTATVFRAILAANLGPSG